jgi:microcystin-dependent protein
VAEPVIGEVRAIGFRSKTCVGEIRMFDGNVAPQGWSFCDGAIVAIATNEALFALLGTAYGGDGQTTFGFPDLTLVVSFQHGQGIEA